MAAQSTSLFLALSISAALSAPVTVCAETKFEILGFDDTASPQESWTQPQAVIGQGCRYTIQNNELDVALTLIDTSNKHNNERAPDTEVLVVHYAAADCDQEITGYGWKTDQKLDTHVATQPTSWQMKRPSLN